LAFGYYLVKKQGKEKEESKGKKTKGKTVEWRRSTLFRGKMWLYYESKVGNQESASRIPPFSILSAQKEGQREEIFKREKKARSIKSQRKTDVGDGLGNRGDKFILQSE